MADTYTNQGMTLPEPGASLNTWGTKLNTVIRQIAAMMTFSNLAITGVAATDTLSFSNGSYTASALPYGLRLTAGGVAAAFTLTLPAVDKAWKIINVSGYTCTAKVSGGTGVAIATGYQADVCYSAAAGDIINSSSTTLPGAVTIAGGLTVAGIITGLTNGVASSDAVSKGQMETAIATLAGVITSGLVLNSSTDLAAKYLQTALTAAATSGILLTPTSTGTVNEYLAASLYINGMTALTSNTLAGNDRLAGYDTSAAAHKSFAIDEVVRRQTATQRFFATA